MKDSRFYRGSFLYKNTTGSAGGILIQKCRHPHFASVYFHFIGACSSQTPDPFFSIVGAYQNLYFCKLGRNRIEYVMEAINLDYKNYKKSRDIAWQVLISENVAALPVKVGALCKNMGISIRYYTPTDENDGKSTIIDGHAHIFVSDQCSGTRQRFTAAHELGHILLGHVGEYQLVNREPTRGDNPIEQAANVFASRVLAPACVLWALDIRTPEEIADLCQISYQAASFRAERMALLYEKNKFLVSPLEQQVYIQFEKFIREKKRPWL